MNGAAYVKMKKEKEKDEHKNNKGAIEKVHDFLGCKIYIS